MTYPFGDGEGTVVLVGELKKPLLLVRHLQRVSPHS